MAPISACHSGRRVITGDRTARLSSFLCYVHVDAFLCVLHRVYPSGRRSRCGGYFSVCTIGLGSSTSSFSA